MKVIRKWIFTRHIIRTVKGDRPELRVNVHASVTIKTCSFRIYICKPAKPAEQNKHESYCQFNRGTITPRLALPSPLPPGESGQRSKWLINHPQKRLPSGRETEWLFLTLNDPCNYTPLPSYVLSAVMDWIYNAITPLIQRETFVVWWIPEPSRSDRPRINHRWTITERKIKFLRETYVPAW